MVVVVKGDHDKGKGYKIPLIENLGASRDFNDVIDFTDNDLQTLSNFPYLPRLKVLLCANNRISSLTPRLAEFLPSLETLVLTNNSMVELASLEPLRHCKLLQYLILLDNPIVRKPGYREWTIWRLPQLRVLDFKIIRQPVSIS